MLYSRPSNYVGSQPNPLIGGCEGSHPILKCDDPGVDYEWIEGQRDSSVVYRLGPRGVQEYGIPPVGIGCVPHFQRNSNSNLHYIPYISGISQLYPHKNGWFMFVSYIQKVNHNSARTPLQGMDCGVFVGCCNLGGNDVDPEGPAPQVWLTFMVDLSWPCLIAGGYIPISYPYWGTLIYPAIGIYGPSLRNYI